MVEDLDVDATPEDIMLSYVSGEKSKVRMRVAMYPCCNMQPTNFLGEFVSKFPALAVLSGSHGPYCRHALVPLPVGVVPQRAGHIAAQLTPGELICDRHQPRAAVLPPVQADVGVQALMRAAEEPPCQYSKVRNGKVLIADLRLISVATSSFLII